MNDDMVGLVKSGLKLFADIMMGIEQEKEGKANAAKGSYVRAARDLIEVVEKINRISAKPAPHKTLPPSVGANVDVTGHWQSDDGKIVRMIDMLTGVMNLYYPNDVGRYNNYTGAIISTRNDVKFLVSGFNSRGEQLIMNCQGNTYSLQGHFWAPSSPDKAARCLYARIDNVLPKLNG